MATKEQWKEMFDAKREAENIEYRKRKAQEIIKELAEHGGMSHEEWIKSLTEKV